MTELTARQTAAAIAAGDMSALEACNAAIARIEALDDPINAVVIRDFDRARVAATDADKEISAGIRKPLLGVPMTIKESFDIGGLPNSWGFAEHADHVSAGDGLTVRQLKAAGAVFLGKTNVPVALADWQSFNPNYGRTNNPHNHAMSPGGSSGGSAAALASDMVPLEYGSDIGGSIRVPAHFCGVWGLKTSFGAVSIEGHPFPRTDNAKTELSVVGPMARDPGDLELALDLTSRFPLPRSRFDSLKGVRILCLTQHPLAAAEREIVAGVETAAHAAAAAGAIVETKTDLLPDLAQLHTDYWRMLMIVLSKGIATEGHSPTSLFDWFNTVDLQARYARVWDRFFERYDAIFCPVLGTPAFPHTGDPDFAARTLSINGEDSPFAPQFAWISMATYGGMPGLSMPLGSMANGLPFNLQIITRTWSDHDAIRLGALTAAAMA